MSSGCRSAPRTRGSRSGGARAPSAGGAERGRGDCGSLSSACCTSALSPSKPLRRSTGRHTRTPAHGPARRSRQPLHQLGDLRDLSPSTRTPSANTTTSVRRSATSPATCTGTSSDAPSSTPRDHARSSTAVTPISSAPCSSDIPLAANSRHRARASRLNLSLRRFCFVSIYLVCMPRPHGTPLLPSRRAQRVCTVELGRVRHRSWSWSSLISGRVSRRLAPIPPLPARRRAGCTGR